jgi:hypothetical protein
VHGVLFQCTFTPAINTPSVPFSVFTERREIKEGKEDKFTMMISKNKTIKPFEKFHLTAVMKRTITYTNKKIR